MNKIIKVLILDDEEGIRVSLKSFLEDDGFKVLLSPSGEDAITLLENKEVDVVIVDMRLPGMDGTTFIKKAHTQNSKLKFIIYTGSPTFDVSPDLLSISSVYHKVFQKPLIDLSVISKTILRLMNLEN